MAIHTGCRQNEAGKGTDRVEQVAGAEQGGQGRDQVEGRGQMQAGCMGKVGRVGQGAGTSCSREGRVQFLSSVLSKKAPIQWP